MTAKEIKDLRIELSMTQPQFAHFLGDIPCSTISRWENGHCKPRKKYLKKLTKLRDDLKLKKTIK